MFPDQNLHYIKNFQIGFPGVSYVKGSEYRNRFKYDQGKAIIALEASSPGQYKRHSMLQENSSYSRRAGKAETLPPYAESLPSQDMRRGSYPESVPPEDEAPPSSAVREQNRRLDLLNRPAEDPKPDQLGGAGMREPVQPAEAQEYRELRAQAEIPEPRDERERRAQPEGNEFKGEGDGEGEVQRAGKADVTKQRQEQEEDEWRRLVRRQAQAAEDARAKETATRRANAELYKEELEKQMREKAQKKEQVHSQRQQEQQRTKDWMQEMAKQDQQKKTNDRQLQELTRQYYDQQIKDRDSAPAASRLPKATPHQDIREGGLLSGQEPRRRESQPTADVDPETAMYEDVRKSGRPLDSMLQLQEVNRQRYKQVRLKTTLV
jgi:hypothetical protein